MSTRITIIFSHVINKILFRLKLKIMDQVWRDSFGYCFGGHPPSFYYLHTPEECQKIIQEENEKLRELIDQL